MLLECSGLAYDQRSMVTTSAGEPHTFDKVCDVLRERHGRIHEGEQM